MPQCCPLRASLSVPATGDRPNVRAGRAHAALARIVAACLAIVGWYRLEPLLGSIPDSNDDFGIV